jgi:tRNA-modifying protein YgfZ
MPVAFLAKRSLVLVEGPDAQTLLQGIITTDVDSLPVAEARPGALLTPQGKILFDFIIWRTDMGFALECDSALSDTFQRRLTMYKLRAAVNLTQGEDGVTITWGDEADSAAGVTDAAFGKAGILLKRQAGGAGEDGTAAYDALRVEAGLVISGADYALQDAFPHDILLDRDGGLSFRKGCYVGQEVVSRMQHRGTARRRVAQVTAESALPASGTELIAAGKPVGTLGTVMGSRGLAIVRIDRVGDALVRGDAITAGDVAVTLSLPAWSGLTFPAEAQEGET